MLSPRGYCQAGLMLRRNMRRTMPVWRHYKGKLNTEEHVRSLVPSGFFVVLHAVPGPIMCGKLFIKRWKDNGQSTSVKQAGKKMEMNARYRYVQMGVVIMAHALPPTLAIVQHSGEERIAAKMLMNATRAGVFIMVANINVITTLVVITAPVHKVIF